MSGNEAGRGSRNLRVRTKSGNGMYAIRLSVLWINRSCKPANPAFTMSEIGSQKSEMRNQNDLSAEAPGFEFMFPSRKLVCQFPGNRGHGFPVIPDNRGDNRGIY